MTDDLAGALEGLLSAEPEQKKCPVARFLEQAEPDNASKLLTILETAEIPAEAISDAITPWVRIAPTTIRRHRRWMVGASNGCNCTPLQEVDPEL